MRTNLFKQIFNSSLLILFVTLSSILILHAQNVITLTVDYSNSADNIYSFDVSGAEVDDLIYYRFSDGYHMTKVMALEVDALVPHAAVERQFKTSGNYRVIAYVAKKGGTLDRAVNTEEINILDNCEECPLPIVAMSTESNINLSTSWNAFFTDGVGGEEEIVALTDEISGPNSPTLEGTPWFFVNLTLESSDNELSGDFLDFNFPDEVFDVLGVIINDEWIPFNPLLLEYNSNGSSSPVSTINYLNNAGNEFIRFHFDQEIEDQANFYLILQGEPIDEFDEYELVGQLFDKKRGRKPIDEFALKITPTQQPHDPNEIYSPIYAPCDDDEITYKVDFQNLGDGEARDVEIVVNLDDDYIDLYSLNVVESSHPFALDSDYIIEDGKITFLFDDISLPGTNQVIPFTPSYNETKGFIKFKLTLHDCLIDDDPNGYGSIITNGEIIFYGQPVIGQPLFVQHTPLNELLQKTCHLPCAGLGLITEANSEFSSSRISSTNITNRIPFSVNSYPTIVDDFLMIESSLLEPGILLEIKFVDIAGRIWENKNLSSQTKMIYKDQIDISHLPRGIYFLQIRYGNQLINKKIVKN